MFRIHHHGLIKESAYVVSEEADDEQHHLQSAHDALSSKITKCKRQGQKCDHLEAKLKTIAGLIGKKD